MDDYNDPQLCFDFVRDGGWTWCVTLRYPSTESDSVKDCFLTWIDWVGQNYGNGNCVSYALAIETLANGDRLLHVLLRDVPEESRKAWREQWDAVGGAGAWDRQLDDRIEGLFKFFYYQSHCRIVIGSNCNDSHYVHGKKEEDDGEWTWD